MGSVLQKTLTFDRGRGMVRLISRPSPYLSLPYSIT
jgi:hypothetical protein